MKIAKDIACELAGSGKGEEYGGFTVLYDEQVDAGRWTTIHLLVVTDGQEFVGAYYERGATEQQDISPFEDEGELIEFSPYKAITRTVTDWEPVT